MTHPQTIDTDALLKQERLNYALEHAPPAILDELDRLRAAEAASKARVKELESRVAKLQIIDRLSSFIIDGMDEMADDAEAAEVKSIQLENELVAAHAEIARLTDAGAEDAKHPLEQCPHCRGRTFAKIDEQQSNGHFRPGKSVRCVGCKVVFAPSPPAAADRGVQDAAFINAMEGDHGQTIDANGGDALRLFTLARAALATAPKVEDVRREEPDYVYVVGDWEFTAPWDDRDCLVGDDIDLDPGGMATIGCLFEGPQKFVARVPVSWHEGEPDDWELKWFDDKQEAIRALAEHAL